MFEEVQIRHFLLLMKICKHKTIVHLKNSLFTLLDKIYHDDPLGWREGYFQTTALTV